MSKMKLFKNPHSGIIVMSTGNNDNGWALGLVIVEDEDGFYREREGTDMKFFDEHWEQLDITYIPRNYNLDDHIAILNMPDEFLKWVDDIFDSKDFKSDLEKYNIDLDGENAASHRKRILTSIFLTVQRYRKNGSDIFKAEAVYANNRKKFTMQEYR